MPETIIVYDFDKTLTYNDSLFGFYRCCNSGFSFYLKTIFFILFIILYRLRFITNDSLKEWGVFLFLKGKKKEYLKTCGKEYFKKIKKNSLYDTIKNSRNIVYICSASFGEYLESFNNSQIKVLGSDLNYDEHDCVVSLKFNCYGHNKLIKLRDFKLNKIDVFYTDSFVDKPVMDISNIVYLVDGDKIKQIKGMFRK